MNLLFLMTDQQRFDARSGHQGWAHTPNLEQLAAGGVDLRGHFSHSPVCVPSRCTLFSGRYAHAHGVLENDARLAPHEAHLLKILKANGYWVAYHGKNHLVPDADLARNLDRFSDGKGGCEDPERASYVALEKAALERLSTIGCHASAQFHDHREDVTTTGRIGAAAVEAVREAPQDRPWCVVASFHDPHVPHLAPRRFASANPASRMVVPEHPRACVDAKHPRLAIKREAQRADVATDADRRHYLAVYASMCSHVDSWFGRIRAALDARSDAAETLVVMTSDHGDFAWRMGLCKKDLVLYDALLHVPCVFHWPARLPAGRVESGLTAHVDILPTILELAGIPAPFGVQGRSMVPLLRGACARHRDAILAEVCYPWMRNGFADFAAFRSAWERGAVGGAPYNVPGDYTKAIRTDRWKFIWYGDGFEELYDLQDDPEELVNLAGTPGLRGTCAELRVRLFRELVETADPHSPRSEAALRAAHAGWLPAGG